MSEIVYTISTFLKRYHLTVATGCMVSFMISAIGLDMARERMVSRLKKENTFNTCGRIIACGMLNYGPALFFSVCWPITVPYTLFHLYMRKELPGLVCGETCDLSQSSST